jgi:hypothetical protein
MEIAELWECTIHPRDRHLGAASCRDPGGDQCADAGDNAAHLRRLSANPGRPAAHPGVTNAVSSRYTLVLAA